MTGPAPTFRGLAPTGLLAGVVAAIGTTAVAATASAADVSLEVDGAAIPLAAFALWTIVGAVLGIVLARVLGDARRFVLVTASITAVSLVPAIALPDDTATRLVLVGTHVLAALVVIPALARRLAASGGDVLGPEV
ncbi:DUF6069 family protein [Aeromicrobium sp. Leaf350]|uniref:DUF6069 family protein n=1 Tax=Aeromicrobium sp. Leaf350 TaxID=2876565 RepID=UPI001E64B2A6|nr:DUF6069 family protein [Aeromicrobium sp. Leaf350]